MNVSYFISSRILTTHKGTFAFTVTKIATFSIAAGLAILVCSHSVLKGFNAKIQDKLFALSGHLQVIKLTNNHSLEDEPMQRDSSLIQQPESMPSVAFIYPFARKPAILKSEEGVQGVLLKGVDSTFTNQVFSDNLIAGAMPVFSDTSFSRDVIISRFVSEKMRLTIGDEFLFYFIQNPPKFRKVKVCGIYETGMEELDHRYVLCDLRLIQGINQWSDDQIGGYELLAKDFQQLEAAQMEVYNAMDYNLALISVKDQYAQIFDWFSLLQNNVQMLMIIVFFIICINVGTSFVIIILEKTRFVGTLKALGASDRQLQTIFLLNGLKVLGKGMLWGNVIGIGFCALQYYLEFIPLDQQNYYVDHVPVLFDMSNIVVSNIGLLLVSLVSLVIPGVVISRLHPIRSIRMQ